MIGFMLGLIIILWSAIAGWFVPAPLYFTMSGFLITCGLIRLIQILKEPD